MNSNYDQIINTIPFPICTFDQNQNLTFSNDAFDKYFDIQDKKRLYTLIEVSRNLEFQNLILKSLTTQKEVKLIDFSFEDALQSMTSQKIYFDITISPTTDAKHFVCTMQDVTEKKITEQIREDFVSNFSHEMRTPLTILRGQLQTLKDLVPQNLIESLTLSELFEKIKTNENRLTHLFNRLLELTSVEKKRAIEKTIEDISPLLYQLVDELSFKYKDKKLKFEFELKNSYFLADYHLFEQVLINLIENAIKYTPAEGTITISTSYELDRHILSIKDTGIGISREHLHRIFERFFRADPSRSNQVEGTGLGLSIVKHIVNKHRGKIKVESQLGVGSTFTIIIPST